MEMLACLPPKAEEQKVKERPCYRPITPINDDNASIATSTMCYRQFEEDPRFVKKHLGIV